MVVGQTAAVSAAAEPWDRPPSFPAMLGARFHLETKHLTSESGSLPLPLAGCAVLDKLLGHYELWFPCLSTEIRCDTAVSNGFNHACRAHMQGVAQGKSPCVAGGAPVLGAGDSFGLNVWLLLRSILSAGAAGWGSSVLRFLAFLFFLFLFTWPAHPAHQAFVVNANLPCH